MIFPLSGGGSGEVISVISATYPVGSTCTATDGKNTITAPDTSGSVIFNVEPGTWTVTATDGTESDSETVEITAEGQVLSVELSYWDGSIYDSGNEYTAYTGGWSVSGKQGWDASFQSHNREGSKDGNELYVWVRRTGDPAWVRTTEKVSLAGVSKIEATVTAQSHSSSWGGNERCRLVVSANSDLSSPIASLQPSNSNAQTLSLSVSTTGSYYVGLYAKTGTASTASMTCSKIRLVMG